MAETSIDPLVDRKLNPAPTWQQWLAQRPRLIAWAAALVAAGIFWWFGRAWGEWAFEYPSAWNQNFSDRINDAMNWLMEDASFGLFTFRDLTRAMTWAIEKPYYLVLSLLSTGFLRGQGSQAVQIIPPLSWIAVLAIVVCLGRYVKDWKLGALLGGCFLYLVVFGQWESAMVTLSSIMIAVPLGIVAALFVGLLAYRWSWFERIITPVLDLMQTVPVFAYLVPVLVMFGFNPVSAMVATVIYAMPPMVRVTILALRQVAPDIVDLGTMVGCTRSQMTFKVLIPSAMPTLMVGVNQVIMLSLNMVIIASMIGAGGLGFDVLSSLRSLNIGAGVEAGLAIVLLAIALDRLSQAMARRTPTSLSDASEMSIVKKYPYAAFCVALTLATGFTGLFWGAAQNYPEAWTISTGAASSDAIKYINVNYFDYIDAVKRVLLENLLVPLRRFLLSLPWIIVVLLLGFAGLTLAGWRLALLCVTLSLFIAAVGLWDKAMVTIYLCGVSVVVACMIGMPIGILAAQRDRIWRIVQVIIDTLQTLPSFVYLMPVVMLFKVGEFSAILAVVAYAVAPAIRYTAHGIRQVDPQLIEAGIVSGCTPFQLLTKVKLKLAFPEIMLGLNQTIMLSLSMLVITALVGTRDLGQETLIALTRAKTGDGIVAGLCVAFIAIIADRLIRAGAERVRARLGLK
jgi:glycine betaine/proline transport system permease protein